MDKHKQCMGLWKLKINGDITQEQLEEALKRIGLLENKGVSIIPNHVKKIKDEVNGEIVPF